MLQAEFDVVAAVRDGHSLVLAAEQWKPDVIVTDIAMPHMDGIQAAKTLVEKNPHAKIIMLTVHDDPAIVHLALSAGAKGYVLKVRASRELSQAIRLVSQGELYLSPGLGSVRMVALPEAGDA